MVPLLAQDNPCNDKIFERVEEVGFENLTEREFEYYKVKTNECEQYKTRKLLDRQVKEQKWAEEQRNREIRATGKKQAAGLKSIERILLLVALFYLLYLGPYALFG